MENLPSKGVHPMARYAYNVTYVPDLSANPLPVNSDAALSRHMSLRKNFKKLPDASKAEFTQRLTEGIGKGYWTVIEGADLDKLRRPEGGGHFLPANDVLKDPEGTASTKGRLMLDPSQVFNGILLTPINVENKIQDVRRKVQSLGIVATQDIKEAFFRLRLSQQPKESCF